VPDQGPRAWVSADYLVWWVKNGPVSTPLLTTGPAAGLGVLGAVGTRPVGEDRFNYGAFSGLRLGAGVWLDEERTVGFEASGFLLEQRSDGFDVASAPNGFPVLGRPFLDPFAAGQSVRLLALPGAGAGTFTATSSSRLWGVSADPVLRLWGGDANHLDLLGGFRFLSLEEGLEVGDTATLLDEATGSFDAVGFTAPGATRVVDRFDTRNHFYAGEVGGRAGFTRGNLVVDLTGKLALGVNDETILVDGRSTLAGATPVPVTAPGGLLAASSNVGKTDRNEFAVVPEASVRVGYRVSDQVSLHAGYSVLYLSRAVRPGDQIDPVVSSTQVPTSPNFALPFALARPAVPFTASDFWAQGLNFGMSLRF
jgi:hypothetical protein